MSEIKEERQKLEKKKYQAHQSVIQECKNKYQLEESKVESHIKELHARKIQQMSQLKDRYNNRISSHLQSLRLQHDKVKTQSKIDNDRRLQAKRDEIKSRLEAKYLQLENELKSKAYQDIKSMAIVEVEKHKIMTKSEADQKMKVITQEYEVMRQSLKSAKNLEY